MDSMCRATHILRRSRRHACRSAALRRHLCRSRLPAATALRAPIHRKRKLSCSGSHTSCAPRFSMRIVCSSGPCAARAVHSQLSRNARFGVVVDERRRFRDTMRLAFASKLPMQRFVDAIDDRRSESVLRRCRLSTHRRRYVRSDVRRAALRRRRATSRDCRCCRRRMRAHHRARKTSPRRTSAAINPPASAPRCCGS